MNYTRYQYCLECYDQIGGFNVHDRRIWWLVAWSCFESIPPNAPVYNLLATTLKKPDSTIYNAVGVQNYTSLLEGGQAFAETINNGLYKNILNLLNTDNPNDAMFLNSNVASDLSTWGTGGDKIRPIFDLTNALFNGDDKRGNDTFNGLNENNTSQQNAAQKQYLPVNNIGDFLKNIDIGMFITNPFDKINATQVNIAGLSFTDPFSWLQQFGTNLFGDFLAIIFRLIIIILGLIILWQTTGKLIKVDIKG